MENIKILIEKDDICSYTIKFKSTNAMEILYNKDISYVISYLKLFLENNVIEFEIYLNVNKKMSKNIKYSKYYHRLVYKKKYCNVRFYNYYYNFIDGYLFRTIIRDTLINIKEGDRITFIF